MSPCITLAAGRPGPCIRRPCIIQPSARHSIERLQDANQVDVRYEEYQNFAAVAAWAVPAACLPPACLAMRLSRAVARAWAHASLCVLPFRQPAQQVLHVSRQHCSVLLRINERCRAGLRMQGQSVVERDRCLLVCCCSTHSRHAMPPTPAHRGPRCTGTRGGSPHGGGRHSAARSAGPAAVPRLRQAGEGGGRGRSAALPSAFQQAAALNTHAAHNPQRLHSPRTLQPGAGFIWL